MRYASPQIHVPLSGTYINRSRPVILMPRLRRIFRLLVLALPLLVCLTALAAWVRGGSASDGAEWFYRPNDSLAAFHSAGNLYLGHQSWTRRDRPVGSANPTFRSFIGYDPDDLYTRVAG